MSNILDSNVQFDEILKNDIFAIKDRHNLSQFEIILKEVNNSFIYLVLV